MRSVSSFAKVVWGVAVQGVLARKKLTLACKTVAAFLEEGPGQEVFLLHSHFVPAWAPMVNGIKLPQVTGLMALPSPLSLASPLPQITGAWHQTRTGHSMTITLVISIASAIGIIITICSTIATGQGLMASSSHRSRVNGCKL